MILLKVTELFVEFLSIMSKKLKLSVKNTLHY